MFQVPVLNFENVLGIEDGPAAKRFRPLYTPDRVPADIRNDFRFPDSGAKRQHPGIGPHRPSRSRVKAGQFTIGVGIEIGFVLCDIAFHYLLDFGIDNQRYTLGAYNMIRGQRPLGCDVLHVGKLAETPRDLAVVGRAYHGLAGSFRDVIT